MVLKKKEGMWILVSRKDPKKVLKIFGPIRPTKMQIAKEERRMQFFKRKGKYTNVRRHKRRLK